MAKLARSTTPQQLEIVRAFIHYMRLANPVPPSKAPDRMKFFTEVCRELVKHTGWGRPTIHGFLKRESGWPDIPSERRIGDYIGGDPIDLKEPEPWKRWDRFTLTQDAGFVLRLEMLTRALTGRELWAHEAQWAVKLEGALAGLAPIGASVIVHEYAWREWCSISETADLDFLVASRPWTDGAAYEAALFTGEKAPHLTATWVDEATDRTREYERSRPDIDHADIEMLRAYEAINAILVCRELGLPYGYVGRPDSLFPEEEFPDGLPTPRLVPWEEADKIHPPGKYPSNWNELVRWANERMIGESLAEVQGWFSEAE